MKKSSKNQLPVSLLGQKAGKAAPKAAPKFIPIKRHAKNWPPELEVATEAIAGKLGRSLMLICHGSEAGDDGHFSPFTRDFVYDWVVKLPAGKPISIILDSPGGDPRCSYQMAAAIKDHCGSYSVIVPRYAKSAATLFSVGAEEILMARKAELGPLDMQIGDHDSESMRSVLEYVQSLERLEAFALRLLDDTMQVLLSRTRKKVGTLLPDVMKFSTDLVRPLFEKVDVVQYTQMARLHKVVEDYAIRLLTSNARDRDHAEELAHRLTSDYSDHSYVIDLPEATRIGLPVSQLPDDLASEMKVVMSFTKNRPLLGIVSV